MATPYTLPCDCALVIGIPLTKQAFLDVLQRPQEGNYAQCDQAKRVNQTPAYLWDKVHSPIATYIEETCQRAEAKGVTVCRSGMPADLRDMLTNFPVVTLATHCLLTGVQPEHLPTPASLLRVIQASAGEKSVVAAVREAVSQRHPDLLEPNASVAVQLAERLASVLNELVYRAHSWYLQKSLPPEKYAPIRITEYPPERLSRAVLEAAFPSLLLPLPVIEMSDRMYSIPDLVDVVPKGFTGLLDLTICNSALLGDAIKREHPHCLVAVNQFEADPLVRFLRYRLLIDELARKPAPFLEVLTRVHSLSIQS